MFDSELNKPNFKTQFLCAEQHGGLKLTVAEGCSNVHSGRTFAFGNDTLYFNIFQFHFSSRDSDRSCSCGAVRFPNDQTLQKRFKKKNTVAKAMLKIHRQWKQQQQQSNNKVIIIDEAIKRNRHSQVVVDSIVSNPKGLQPEKISSEHKPFSIRMAHKERLGRTTLQKASWPQPVLRGFAL